MTIKGSQLRGPKDEKEKDKDKEKEKDKEGAKALMKGNKLSERKLIAYIRPGLAKKKMKRIASNQAMLDGFLTLAKLKLGYLHSDKRFKIGVVYWKGHLLEEQTLALSTPTQPPPPPIPT